MSMVISNQTILITLFDFLTSFTQQHAPSLDLLGGQHESASALSGCFAIIPPQFQHGARTDSMMGTCNRSAPMRARSVESE